MNIMRANKFLIEKGFPAKIVNEEYDDFTALHSTFVGWQMMVNDDKPITFVFSKSKDIDNLYRFAVMAARLFLINDFNVELLNSGSISSGYLGKAFFIVIEDGYALTVSEKDNVQRMILDRIKSGRPIMILLLSEKDIGFMDNDFLENIKEKVVVVEV